MHIFFCRRFHFGVGIEKYPALRTTLIRFGWLRIKLFRRDDMNHIELWKFAIGAMFGLFIGTVAGALAMKIMPGFFVWRKH